MVPWMSGKCATWDVAVVDTLGGAYLRKSAIQAASAAETAAVRETEKYRSLEQTYLFVPIAMETLGPMCEDAQAFIGDIGHKISDITSDPRPPIDSVFVSASICCDPQLQRGLPVRDVPNL